MFKIQILNILTRMLAIRNGRLLNTGPAAGALALLLAWPAGLAAQNTGPNPRAAQPQRPTVATHAGTVTRGWLEIEAGTEFDRYSGGSRGAVAPVLFKFGLAPRGQLEVAAPIVSPPGVDTTGVGDFSIGLKWRLAEAAPIVNDFAILPSLKAPTGSSTVTTDTTDLGVLFISSRAVGSVAVDLNFGYTHRSGDGSVAPQHATVWTASFGGPARGAIGWVAELYGYPGTSGPSGADSTVALLVGPTLRVRDWLILDVGLIGALTGPQPTAVYLGATYNVGRVF